MAKSKHQERAERLSRLTKRSAARVSRSAFTPFELWLKEQLQNSTSYEEVLENLDNADFGVNELAEGLSSIQKRAMLFV